MFTSDSKRPLNTRPESYSTGHLLRGDMAIHSSQKPRWAQKTYCPYAYKPVSVLIIYFEVLRKRALRKADWDVQDPKNVLSSRFGSIFWF